MEFDLIEKRMEKTIEHLEDELADIRAGRANPAILNKVMVDYYGMPTPVNQVGTISVPEARQKLISPWDKSNLSKIERTI